PGVYSLINARSGTAADLHGGDHRSLIGYTSHGGKNQQWKFEPLGDGYSICS
ncbi:carbohydrate-binding module family 13 protein, partial [Phlebiopsis gigantea 11061_1 CR5-6]